MRRNNPSRKSQVTNEVTSEAGCGFARERLRAAIVGDVWRTKSLTDRSPFTRVSAPAFAAVPRQPFISESSLRKIFGNSLLLID